MPHRIRTTHRVMEEREGALHCLQKPDMQIVEQKHTAFTEASLLGMVQSQRGIWRREFCAVFVLCEAKISELGREIHSLRWGVNRLLVRINCQGGNLRRNTDGLNVVVVSRGHQRSLSTWRSGTGGVEHKGSTNSASRRVPLRRSNNGSSSTQRQVGVAK